MSEWLNSTLTIRDFRLPFTPKEMIFRFVIPVFAILMAGLIVSVIIRRVSRKYLENEEKRANLFTWTRRIIRTLVFVGIILSFFSLLGAEAWAAFADFFRILNKPFFTTGSTRISVISLILIIPVVAVASWAGKLVSRGLSSGALNRFGLDAEQSFSIGRLVRYAVMVLVFIFGLSIVGIDLSALGVLFGVLGLGIGFGLQSLVADFFAGVTLISMGLIKEGDRIRVGGSHDGIIQRIRLMNTELNTFENETLIIPNSQLTGGTIHNYSYKDRRIVIVNEVDVAYESNLDHVIAVMKGIADRNPWLSSGSEGIVRVKVFAESGITMQLRTWVKDVEYRAEAFSWSNLEIWRSFLDEGIQIPFPQRVVHNAPLPSEVPDSDDLSRADAASLSESPAAYTSSGEAADSGDD